eukprot:TRINITY_DN6451_c1_g1_i1.p1 TRINITY_DN6451_c1_g1~~TRINITY_DN6451_c1_g1_i1.p1  ORF type:complete len:260 (+),score=50.50 TRINITY_DN6451_c1_g1_i1:326-1105(+)
MADADKPKLPPLPPVAKLPSPTPSPGRQRSSGSPLSARCTSPHKVASPREAEKSPSPRDQVTSGGEQIVSPREQLVSPREQLVSPRDKRKGMYIGTSIGSIPSRPTRGVESCPPRSTGSKDSLFRSKRRDATIAPGKNSIGGVFRSSPSAAAAAAPAAAPAAPSDMVPAAEVAAMLGRVTNHIMQLEASRRAAVQESSQKDATIRMLLSKLDAAEEQLNEMQQREKRGRERSETLARMLGGATPLLPDAHVGVPGRDGW